MCQFVNPELGCSFETLLALITLKVSFSVLFPHVPIDNFLALEAFGADPTLRRTRRVVIFFLLHVTQWRLILDGITSLSPPDSMCSVSVSEKKSFLIKTFLAHITKMLSYS